jgi:hypothetical protein
MVRRRAIVMEKQDPQIEALIGETHEVASEVYQTRNELLEVLKEINENMLGMRDGIAQIVDILQSEGNSDGQASTVRIAPNKGAATKSTRPTRTLAEMSQEARKKSAKYR